MNKLVHLSLEIQGPAHVKHTEAPLQRPKDKWCLGKLFLFVLKIIWNTSVLSVGKNSSFFFHVNASGVCAKLSVLKVKGIQEQNWWYELQLQIYCNMNSDCVLYYN